MTHSGERKIEAVGDEIYEKEGNFCKNIKCSRCDQTREVLSVDREALAGDNKDYICGLCDLKEKGFIKDTEKDAA